MQGEKANSVSDTIVVPEVCFNSDNWCESRCWILEQKKNFTSKAASGGLGNGGRV